MTNLFEKQDFEICNNYILAKQPYFNFDKFVGGK